MNKYDRTVNAIRERRREDIDTAHMAWLDLLASDAALKAAHIEYQKQAVNKAAGKKNTLDEARAALKTELKRLGKSKSDFDPPCRCKLCNDTGLVGGKYCSCVIKAAISADRANLMLPDVDIDAAEKTAPQSIKKLYSAAREYINAYPADPRPFFAMIGAPGTGKTVLASAIASALILKGASAVTVTAFEFVRRALDYHTQFTINGYVDRFTPMLDCDILVIDDLGKESMLKNVTVEYLYAVIDSRHAMRKNTVITSNLDPAEIIARYGEAIFSRMFDSATSEKFIIDGKNERM